MEKRNKSYQPKRLTIPMMFVVGTVADKYPLMADSLLAQITSFCLAPSIETSNTLSRTFAELAGGMSYMNKGEAIRGKRDPASIAICSAIACIEGIASRFERTGTIAVTDLERKTMTAASSHLFAVLRKMPLACYEKAKQEAGMWLKEAKEPELEAA